MGNRDPRIDAFIAKAAPFAMKPRTLAEGKPRNWKYMKQCQS